jgi:hypothetical protein
MSEKGNEEGFILSAGKDGFVKYWNIKKYNLNLFPKSILSFNV